MQPYLNVLQYYPFLLKGLMYTIEISLIGMVFGTIVGIVSALALLSPFRAVRWLGILYIWTCLGARPCWCSSSGFTTLSPSFRVSR